MDILLSRKVTPGNLEIPDWEQEITTDHKNSAVTYTHISLCDKVRVL